MRHTRTEIAKQEAEESIEELNRIEAGGHSSQPHTLSELCLNMTLGQAGRESDSVWRLRMPSKTERLETVLLGKIKEMIDLMSFLVCGVAAHNWTYLLLSARSNVWIGQMLWVKCPLFETPFSTFYLSLLTSKFVTQYWRKISLPNQHQHLNIVFMVNSIIICFKIA